MRLKQLSLQGYKTFAIKTVFEFDDGITAVVGPNGSGKSNIADAIRWVLGEQSFGTLRGKRTEDMIFAGSQRRPRAGMAQALLTLDNRDGWLPIDYSEIEIGRRAFRSGENEYLLNGQRVRLRDISELLATSGLAERTYTIIGQGLIDRALSLRADERRKLFEEAAGISNYKSKRAETLRRLEETEHNLERVQDILAEIRPRLSTLKRQANRAQNYNQVSADLRHQLRLWYGFQWEQAKHELREARQVSQAVESEWNSSRQQIQVFQGQADDLKRKMKDLRQSIAEDERLRETYRSQVEKLAREAAVLEERYLLLERQRLDDESEVPGLLEHQTLSRQQLDLAVSELASAQSELSSLEEKLKQFQTTYAVQQYEYGDLQQQSGILEQEQGELQSKTALAEGRLSQLSEQLESLRTALLSHEEVDEIRRQAEEQEKSVREIESDLAAFNEDRAKIQSERSDLITNLKQNRADALLAEQAIGDLQTNVAQLQARCDMLQALRKSDAHIPDDFPIIGRLATMISIPRQYEMAIEAALSARLKTVVVSEESSLWQLIDLNKGETIAAVATDRVKSWPSYETPEHPAVIGWADDLVSVQKAHQELVRFFLGRVLIVTEARDAYRLSRDLPIGTMAVSTGGFVAHADGIVEKDNVKDDARILDREERWRSAQGELEDGREELVQAERRLKDLRELINTQQSLVEELNERDSQLAAQEKETVLQLGEAQRLFDLTSQTIVAHEKRHAEGQAEISRLSQQVTDIKSRIEINRERLAEVAATLQTLADRLETSPFAKFSEQQLQLEQRVRSVETIVAGRQAVVDSRRTTLNQVDQQLQRLQDRLQDIAAQRKGIDLETRTDQLKQHQVRLADLDDKLRPKKDSLDTAEEKLREVEGNLLSSQRSGQELELRYTKAKITEGKKENQIDSLRERIQADLGLVALDFDEDQLGQSPLPIAEVVEQLPAVDDLPEDIDDTIQRLRAQLNRMGAVNPEAPAEYEETYARYEFLGQQVDDLNGTQDKLRQVIAELDEHTSRAFASTVERVDLIFGQVFKRLFGGGAAKLVLTEPEDMTNSGVDIVARLPHRREQGLALLSGGERSLTATALIFALLKVSPTPFCVLDEVDAMLDEANVNRFRELLAELSHQTQFIVITHNRGTVEAAETVYGVSMGADSASQVVSIRPEDFTSDKVRIGGQI